MDVNRHRLTTFHSDVLGYKAVIEGRWPELQVVWDTDVERWLVIQTDKHNTQSLVFETAALGEHTLERLRRADNENSDAFDEVEGWNEKMEKEQERRNAERIHEVGEKLAWAIRKDEFNGPCPRIFYAAEKQARRVG